MGIERYREIYDSSIHYYIYTITNSYGFGSGVSSFNRTNIIYDIKDLDLSETSQILFTIPGYNKLEIFLNQRYFLNLVFNDFTNAAEYNVGEFAPALREWEYFEGNTYSLAGLPFMNIKNAIKRLGWNVDSGESGYEYYEYQEGIGTQFQMTVTEITNLTIQWKSSWYCGSAGADACSMPSLFTFHYYYFVRFVGTDNYLYYDTDNFEWVILETTDEKEACNKILISGSAAFKDYIYKAFPKVTIPMSDIDTKITDSGSSGTSLLGDYNLEIMIGLCIAKKNIEGTNQAPIYGEWVGDIVVTVDNNAQDNLITGELDNNVLKDERVEIDIFDSDNLNYANTLLTDTLYDKRTETWVEDEDSSGLGYTLAEWNLISKFQLFNRNRKRIKTKLVSSKIFKPFDLFIDGNDGDRKYVLGSYRWNIIRGEYDAQFEEYDNTETVNLK